MAEPCYEELRVTLDETKRKLESREQRLRELGIDDWEPKVPPAADWEPAPRAWEPTPPAEKVVVKLCRHIRVNGQRCRGVATTGRDYCYYHLDDLGRRLKMARARARGQPWRLDLPPLEDLYAVQVSLTQVIAAMAEGHIDRSLGGVMLYGLQQAATNLRLPKEVWEGSYHFDDVKEVECPAFEKEHDVPAGFDLNTPPEEAFPPPQEPAAEALPRIVGALGEAVVTEDDVELDELKDTDREAYQRRRAQIDRKRRRKLDRRERKLARARRVVEAVRRNEEARKQPGTAGPDARDGLAKNAS